MSKRDICITINGREYRGEAEPRKLLVDFIRDDLGLTGTHVGCEHGVCGACTVLIDNQREHSCVFNVSSAVGKKIVTIEGLAADAQGQKAQKAWIDKQVPQCGYCQPGMLMACVGSMKAGRHGSEIASDMKHLCACGTYQRIRTAILGL